MRTPVSTQPALRPAPGRGQRTNGLSLAVLGLLSGLTCACAPTGRLTNQVYTRGRITYRIGALPAAWQPVQVKGAEVAFHHRSGGTIAASAQCPSGEDIPLDVLTNHLLFGFASQVVLDRTLLTLDGRAALRTHLRSELDGVPVEFDLIVMKKDGCTYDLQLLSSPDRFASVQRDFDGFVRGFTTTPSSPALGER